MREISILQLCQGHPNIVHLHEVLNDEVRVCVCVCVVYYSSYLYSPSLLLLTLPLSHSFTLSPSLPLLSLSFCQLHVYLVMEILRGGELLERLRRREPALTEARASAIFLQLVQAVQAMHSKRVVHRDLKPEVYTYVGMQILDYIIIIFLIISMS